MRAVKFTFDDMKPFDGFAHESTWNGFDNVAVTPAVRDHIVAYFESIGDDCAEMRDIPVGNDGLVSLGWGYATQIVHWADMLVLYTSDNEAPISLTLGALIKNFDESATEYWLDDIRGDLESRGWYSNLHENGRYLIINLAKLNLTHQEDYSDDESPLAILPRGK